MTKLQVVAAYDGAPLQDLPLDSAADLEDMLAEAQASHEGRLWLPKSERLAILERAASLIDERAEQLARTAASEGGKPLLDSRVEIARAADGVRAACAVLRTSSGREIPMGLGPASSGRFAHTHHEPRGVVGAISAFNHPFNLIVHQVIPAVATGCPVIVKPASKTPLSCLALLEILAAAGLPRRFARAALLDRSLAESLASDPRLGFFSFIGSAEVGWKLRRSLGRGVSAAFEHGGVAPVLVHESADLPQAAAAIVKGGYYHAGQVCVSVQRVFVQRPQLQELLGLLTPAVSALVVGDPLDEKTEVGPLISSEEVSRVDEWVREARLQGGRIECGGNTLSRTTYAPTIVVDPPDHVRLSQQEVFGPVVCVYTCDSWDEAIERANRVDTYFQAALFCRDLDVALAGARRLNGTTVMVNDHTAFRVDWMPFGGQRNSGLGLGGIECTMHEMTNERLVVFRSPGL